MADYDISKAFEVIEDELIRSMIRNLDRHRAEETAQGFNWSQWQAEQLRVLEEYRRKNSKIFPSRFNKLNSQITQLLNDSYHNGGVKQERRILQEIKRGFKGKGTNEPPYTGKTEMTGEFFGVNDRKLPSLIDATTHDMQKAETAVLRLADDQYRKAIFNAQVYANAGAGTYEKAVDMATRDMLRAGLNCILYRNGARHTLSDYCERISQYSLDEENKKIYKARAEQWREKEKVYADTLNTITTENQKVFNISNNPATENSTSNTVANSNGSGIIDNKKEPLYKPVTLSSLSKIPKMNIFEDNKLNTLHLQARRNLLVKVFQSNEPVGTEFSIVYGENMKLIDKSDEKGNKIGTYTYHKGIVGRTKIENPGVPYHAFHNHGSGKTFSFPDIFGFARTENMISLTAVGNTGSKFVLYRKSNRDNQGYDVLKNRFYNFESATGVMLSSTRAGYSAVAQLVTISSKRKSEEVVKKILRNC